MTMKKCLLWGIMFIGVLSLTDCGFIKADIKMSQKKCDEAMAIQEATDEAAGSKSGVDGD